MRREKELRCVFCDTEPLLATYGIDRGGQLFIHIKTYKQSRLISEVFIRGGSVTLRCPKCNRYQNVRMRQRQPGLVETHRPHVPNNPAHGSSLPAHPSHT